MDCFASLAMTGRARTTHDRPWLVTRPATIGFGTKYPEFWINLRERLARVEEGSGTDICLRARSTDEVDAVHAAALRAGGRPTVALGLRPHDRVRLLRGLCRRSRRQSHRDGDVSAGVIKTVKACARPRARVPWCLQARGMRPRGAAAGCPRPVRPSKYRSTKSGE